MTATGDSATKLTLVRDVPDGEVAERDFAYRELRAVREIAHAFLVADRPEDVHQFALDRVTPLLGASFSLVFLLDQSGDFMYPVAQHEWPERYAAWIGALRVRVGQGPSGVAVAEQRVVEVTDLHADPLLSDWFEVATELGFRSIVAAPLIGSKAALGAISFYFADEREVSAEQRDLVRLIADQLAATTDKAQMFAELRRANAALAEVNAALEAQAAALANTQRRHFVFFENFTRAIGHEAAADHAPETRLSRVNAFAYAAQQAVALEARAMSVAISDIDPRDPLLAAVAAWRSKARPLPITVGEPTVLLPTMRSDAPLMTRALDLALGVAVQEAMHAGGGVHADVELGRGFVAYRLQWTPLTSAQRDSALDEPATVHSDAGAKPFDPFDALAVAVKRYDSPASDTPLDFGKALLTSALDLPLSRSLARLLGGDVQRISERSAELAIESFSLIFPLDAAPDTDAAMSRLAVQHAH